MYILKTKASTFPVTLSEVKGYCRITHSAEDTLVQSLIYAAINLVEDFAWLQIMNATWLLQLNEWPTSYIELGKGKVSSVVSVKYNDADGAEQTMEANTDYKVDLNSWPARIVFINQPQINSNLPFIRVEFVAGYGTDPALVPDNIKDAIYLTARSLYDNRNDAMPTAMPRAAHDLLRDYRNSLVKR